MRLHPTPVQHLQQAPSPAGTELHLEQPWTTPVYPHSPCCPLHSQLWLCSAAAQGSPWPRCPGSTLGLVPREGRVWAPQEWGQQLPLTLGSHCQVGLACLCWWGQDTQSVGHPGQDSAAVAAEVGTGAHLSWQWRRQCGPQSSLPGRRHWPGTRGEQWGTRVCWSQRGSGDCWAHREQGLWGQAEGTGGLGAGLGTQAPLGSPGESALVSVLVTT